jgi:hypothetical protein
MLASHKVRNGFCTVLVNWPHAATIRVVAATTVGCVVSASEGESNKCGTSNAGKSRGFFGVMGDVGVGGSVGELGEGEGEDECWNVADDGDDKKTWSMSFMASSIIARRALRWMMVILKGGNEVREKEARVI